MYHGCYNSCVLFLKQIPEHMWCPTSLEVNGKETKYPLPEPYLPLNFPNSTGMRYEAEEVRQCLLKGTCNLRIWRELLYITFPQGGVRNNGDAPIIKDVVRKATTVYHFLTLWLLLSLRVPPLLFRAEGEYSYVPCRLSAAGRAGGWNSQTSGGGVQPGLPVNEETLCTSSHYTPLWWTS